MLIKPKDQYANAEEAGSHKRKINKIGVDRIKKLEKINAYINAVSVSNVQSELYSTGGIGLQAMEAIKNLIDHTNKDFEKVTGEIWDIECELEEDDDNYGVD